MFLDKNDFRKNNFFFRVWLHSGKFSEKYFTVLCKRYNKRGGVRRAFLENCLRKNWA